MNKTKGISLDRIFTDETTLNLLKSIVCKICQLVSYDIFICTNHSCGEYVCLDCVSIETNSCPFCKGVLNNSKSLMIKPFQKILIECCYKGNSCTEKLRYFELVTHEEKCSFQRVKCSSIFCNYQDLLGLISSHEEFCDDFGIKCSACNEMFRRKDLNDHKNKCLEKSVFCFYCNETFLRKELGEHHKECEYAEVECENCRFKYQRIKKNEHNCLVSLNTNFIQNLNLLEERIQTVEGKLSIIEENMEKFETNLNEKLTGYEERAIREIKRVVEITVKEYLKGNENIKFINILN
jgi:hypothetical protein